MKDKKVIGLGGFLKTKQNKTKQNRAETMQCYRALISSDPIRKYGLPNILSDAT
jgi:hypothetical protein